MYHFLNDAQFAQRDSFMCVPDLPYQAICLTDSRFYVKNFNGFPILKHINYSVFLVLPVVIENMSTMILGN